MQRRVVGPEACFLPQAGVSHRGRDYGQEAGPGDEGCIDDRVLVELRSGSGQVLGKGQGTGGTLKSSSVFSAIL